MSFKSTSLLFITTVVLLLPPTSASFRKDPCQRAFERCDFRFLFRDPRFVPTFFLGKADRAFTTRIISRVRGEIPGVLNTNGIIPEVIFPGGAIVPITAFGNPRFTPTHLKPFSIPGTTGSGVGFQTLQGNQRQLAKGRCVRIFFTHYQLLKTLRGPVIGNANDVPKRANKCVVFRIR